MAKYSDLRPTTPRDSLKKLLAKTENKQTIPHGVKVAKAHEATIYQGASGQAWRWDGDTIASYNQRLEAGESAIAQANEKLALAQAELEAAKDRIDAAGGDLSIYIEKVDSATQAVADAKASMLALESRLGKAEDKTNTVAGSIGAVESTLVALDTQLGTHQSWISTAMGKASEAADQAVAALTASQSVQANADNALATAQKAKEDALAAAGLAQGKGKVIFSSARPAQADELVSNLWVRLPENTPHRWDGSGWVAVTDKAVVDAVRSASDAQATADQAVADAKTAKSVADKAVADAKAAQASADTAKASAQTAQRTADTANQAATTAQSSADTAKASADTAQTTANKAVADASGAKSVADKAVADAKTAQASAETANAKALEAAGVAGGKGKVIFSTTAPAGSDRVAQNLWIRSTDNKPHTWNGTAWVAITDKAALDAATAAATAQSEARKAQGTADKAVADSKTAQDTADKAVADAKAAQGTADQAIKDAATAASSAQQANIAAGNAQRTADGKSVNSYGVVTPPPAPGVARGDRYSVVGADQRITEQWEWDSNKWVKRALDSAQLVNFDASYITSGYLDVTKRLRAGSINADKLFVGVGDNLLPPLSMSADVNGERVKDYFTDGTGYTGGVGVTIPAGTVQTGSYLSNANGGDYLVKVNPGNAHRVSAWVKPGTIQGRATIYVRFINSATKAWAFGTPSTIFQDNLPAGAWSNLSGTITPPASITYDSILIGFYVNGEHDEMIFSDPSVREMKDGSLIVNGSITGTQINAESVGATVGSFVKVRADNVEVTGALAARVAQVMDLSAKKLIVTEEAILAHATLIGSTTAEYLNVTKKLVARDAIIDGTLDVAQLNVTSGMSAAIVNAMDVNAKRLIVTEDAVLNQLTVIENIVTPELIAERIKVKELASEMLTAGVLQTSEQANRGIKISARGISAFDELGNQTINLDGKNNSITGEFATGRYGVPRIRAYERYNDFWKSQEAVLDIHASGVSGVSSYDRSYGRISMSAANGLLFEVGNHSNTIRMGYGGIVLGGDTTVSGNLSTGNLRVNGSFPKSRSFFAVSRGPLTIQANSTHDVNYAFPDTGVFPFFVPVIGNNLSGVPLAVSIHSTSTTKATVRVTNTTGTAVNGIYVDLCCFPFER